MSEPFLGQVEIYGFDYAPKNWAKCAGQLLATTQYQALFSLLGTAFGGNGMTTFGLPDLRSRVPMGMGRASGEVIWTRGQHDGTESVALSSFNLPAHVHSLKGSSATTTDTNNNAPSSARGLGMTKGVTLDDKSFAVNAYVSDAKPAAILHPSALSKGGNAAPHENRMPLLALNFCIALAGTYPSRG